MLKLCGTADRKTQTRPRKSCARHLGAAYRLLGLAIFVMFSAVLLFGAATFFGLMVSETDSAAPAGIYRLTDAHFRRGDLVAACLPEAIARQGLIRGYLQRGDCPADAEPVSKILGALPGDVVDIEPGEVSVNGAQLGHQPMAVVDSVRRPLSHVKFGRQIVAPNQVWLLGFNNRQSWDSRYFGPIPIADVRGKIAPIFTW